MALNSLFLIGVLALPGWSFKWPSILSWKAARTEEEKIRDFIHQFDPEAEVYISPKDEQKRPGYERTPFIVNGKSIWIKQKPKQLSAQA